MLSSVSSSSSAQAVVAASNGSRKRPRCDDGYHHRHTPSVTTTTTTTTPVVVTEPPLALPCSSSSSSGATDATTTTPSTTTPSTHANQDGSTDKTLLDVENTVIQKEEILASPPLALASLLPLPDSCSNDDPDEYLMMLLAVLCPNTPFQVQPALELTHYFPSTSSTEEQTGRYNTDIVQITRTNDVAALRQYCIQHGPTAFDCYNRFGEGLLNMTCRRGFTDMVEFLLSPPVQLPVRVRDDYGRTPLHDACWNPTPQLEICTWILQKDTSLFLVADKRGYTPFQYARKSDWPIWRQFLYQHWECLLVMMTQPDIRTTFSKKRMK
jgi:hypothetical protein